MSTLRVYAVPAVLGIASIGGLVLALVSEGWLDAVALVLVTAPLAVILRHSVRARSSRGDAPSR